MLTFQSSNFNNGINVLHIGITCKSFIEWSYFLFICFEDYKIKKIAMVY